MALRGTCNRLLKLRGHLRSIGARLTGSLSSAAREVLDTRQSVAVHDSHISYLDTGAADGRTANDNTVLFLHGNPTSAFLWRNVIPHVKPIARCVAPDLIGMGHSGKPPGIKYKFVEHYDYLSTWIEKMNFPGKVTIVCHDWGSGLGLHWCREHQQRVHAIVHMESVVAVVPSWDAFPEVARKAFQLLRSEAGEELVLKKNFFLERLLPTSIIRKLEEDEMNEYRQPYKDEQSRLPMLTWPREIPIATDGPQDVVDIVNAYRSWLRQDETIPKLYIDGNPGFFSPGIRQVTSKWPNHRSVTVKGLHFLQEDSPDDIGQAIKSFLQEI